MQFSFIISGFKSKYIACNLGILKNRIDYFSVETNFCQVSNMASSGLKKMFILQVYTHIKVHQKMFDLKNIFLFVDGRCYAII